MPNLNYLKVWGCLAKIAVPKPKKVKVGPKTVECVFIGYAQNSHAYRFLVHKSEIPDIHVNTIIESRDPSFFENRFSYNIVYESIDNNKRSRDTISIDNYLIVYEKVLTILILIHLLLELHL